jgi:hypothetical protein
MKHDFNRLLLTLYHNPVEHYLTQSDFEAFQDLEETLIETGIYHRITQDGIDFLSSLPPDFARNPYDYYRLKQFEIPGLITMRKYPEMMTVDQRQPLRFYESWQFWITVAGIILAILYLSPE